MALEACRECGKQISTAAHACPNCGAPAGSPVRTAATGTFFGIAGCLAAPLILGLVAGLLLLLLGLCAQITS